MILWVGAGLAALIGLLTTGLTSRAPQWLNSGVGTLAVVGAGVLSLARIKFEWGATQLQRAIDDGTDGSTALPDAYKSWPKVGEVAWILGFLIVLAGGLLYLAGVWYSADLMGFWHQGS